MESPLEAAEFRVRQALPQASGQFVHNLLYLAQGYALRRVQLPLFLNGVAPVMGGVQIDREKPSSQMEQCATRATLDAVIDEVSAEFSTQPEDAVARVVKATEGWQEAYAGGWCLAPEIIRDEFARGLPGTDRSM